MAVGEHPVLRNQHGLVVGGAGGVSALSQAPAFRACGQRGAAVREPAVERSLRRNGVRDLLERSIQGAVVGGHRGVVVGPRAPIVRPATAAVEDWQVEGGPGHAEIGAGPEDIADAQRLQPDQADQVHVRIEVGAGFVDGVVEVDVGDYQRVRSGQVLARVDARIYRARVDQAQANLDAALAALANSTQAHAARTAGLQGQAANLASAEAQLVRARADMQRDDDLVRDGSVSVRERDQNLAAFHAAEAQVLQARASAEIARQDIRTVDVGRGGLEANVEAARAQLRLAEIDLDHTVIRAPETGQLGQIGVRLGQYVTNGTQMVSLIPADRWIIADFKESQTHQIRRGDRATFTVDALGGARFSGHVEDLSPAAGSEFAVLKPDNATGNFVKVPQRIGVRIGPDPGQRDIERLSPGMSVEARVDTRR